MLKHLPILMLSLALSPLFLGCTSGDKEAESADADVEMTESLDGEAVAEEGADPFDSEMGSEGGDAGEVADLGASDLAPDAAAGGEADPFADLEEGAAGDSAAGGDDFGLDEGGDEFAMDEGGTADATTDAEPLAEAPPLEESIATESPDTFAAEEPSEAPTDLGSASDTFSSEEPETFQESPERAWVPLKKITDQPFTKSGVLANAVYIARPGDTIESVSQKIYGMDRTEDLYKVNPTYRTSSLDVGEKVYYNSPIRPEDNTSMKIFYEDMGLAPETYIAQEGDNIRTVSKNLLGDANSWKEIWSTNMGVESKDVLAAGTQLMYWTGGETPAPPAMASTPPPSSMPPPPGPQDSEMANSMPPPPPAQDLPDSVPPPPPPQDMAANEPPPPPDMGGMDEPPPPPPPPAMGSVEPPPPPPPPAGMAAKRAKAPTGDVGFGAAAEQEQVMMIAIGAGLVLTALILFIIIRKKKSRRHIDFNTATQTQIE